MTPPAGWPPPGWPPPAPPVRRISPVAVVALVLALCFAPIGLILGALALGQVRQTGERGRGLAIAAVVLSSLVLLAGLGLGAVAVALIPSRGEQGQLTGPGQVPASLLRAGDCVEHFDGHTGGWVTAVPCTSPHQGEVVTVWPLEAGGDNDEAIRAAPLECRRRLDEAAPARSGAFNTLAIVSTSLTQRLGQGHVVCVAYNETDQIGSFRG